MLHANPQQTSNENESLSNSLDIHSKAALILDAATEIKSLHGWLLELETLINRDVAGAGNLNGMVFFVFFLSRKHIINICICFSADHTNLKPLLQDAAKTMSEMSDVYSELEDRVGQIADRYDSFVDSVSEVFLEWHRVVSAVESGTL